MTWITIAVAALAAVAVQVQAQPAASIVASAPPACAIGAATLDAELRERFMALGTAMLDQREGTLQALRGVVPVITDALRQDLVRRSVYVSCDGLVVYVVDRGGLRDEARWYGPLDIAALPAAALPTATAVAKGGTGAR